MTSTPIATILVADDDAVARDLLVEVLEREGYRVLAAGSGDECVAIAASRPCDLALVDLRQPGVDALAVLERLAALDVPPTVLILTAFATARTAAEVIQAGAYDYLSKPFRMEEITRVVRRALQARRLAPGRPR